MALIPDDISAGKRLPLHEAVRSLGWLLGRWRCVDARVTYPTMQPLTYSAQFDFSHVQQPLLNFSASSWDPDSKAAIHLESGYLRPKPGTNNIALMTAHGLGYCTVEEGTFEGKKLCLTSSHIGGMSYVRDHLVTKTKRTFELLDDGKLEYVMYMQTVKTPLQEHLRALFVKVEDRSKM